MGKKRVFVACSDERLRIALLLRLQVEPGLAVVGITDRLTSLLPQLEAADAEVLLLEWDLPGQSIADLLSSIRGLRNPPKIISFSKPEEKEQILAAGADHFICMNSPPDGLPLIIKGLFLHQQMEDSN